MEKIPKKRKNIKHRAYALPTPLIPQRLIRPDNQDIPKYFDHTGNPLQWKLFKYIPDGMFFIAGGIFMSLIFVNVFGYYLSYVTYVSVYGIITFIMLFIQITMAEIYRRQSKKFEDLILPPTVPLAFLVVGWREDPEIFRSCLLSVKSITHPLMYIVISIDGNEEEDNVMRDIAQDVFKDIPRVKIKMNKHGGKRSALYHGIRYIRSRTPAEFMLTTDSDSEVDPDVWRLATPMFHFSDIHSTCGRVELSNWNKNLLTRILLTKYVLSFWLERNALSYIGASNCSSGPCGAFRVSILTPEFLSFFHKQPWLGRITETGDDRQITAHALDYGYAISISSVRALSHSPTELLPYIRQQTRWMMSWARCVWFDIRHGRHLGWYSTFYTVYTFAFGYLLMAYILIILYMYRRWEIVLFSLAVALFISFIKTFYLVLATDDIRLLAYPLYIPLYVFVALPLRVYSFIFQMDGDRWITKDNSNNQFSWNAWYRRNLSTIFVIIWCLSILSGVVFNVTVSWNSSPSLFSRI